MRVPSDEIECAYCLDPAMFVWQNNDPGPLDGLDDDWPYAELNAETAVCDTCESLVDRGLVVEMVDQAVTKFCTAVDGGVIGPGWSGYERRDFAARVAAWLMRRETFYVIGAD